MTTATTTKPPSHNQSAVVAMYLGLTLTVAAIIVPFVDHVTGNVLADHIRAGYPYYSQARIDTAVTTYLTLLSIIGALGIGSWLWTIWAVRTNKRWARTAATIMFLLGTVIALTDLLITDTSGDTGLPALLGWVGVFPCLPGLAAIALLWTRGGHDAASRST